jgi:hypothetical protein
MNISSYMHDALTFAMLVFTGSAFFASAVTAVVTKYNPNKNLKNLIILLIVFPGWLIWYLMFLYFIALPFMFRRY